jgi:transcriptional regulator with XRE-family HTH domain
MFILQGGLIRMNELSKLLIKLRGDESGRKAAKRAGISHNYLAILEKGFDPQTKAPINPSPETLMNLSSAYDYPYEELMKVAGYLKGSTEETKESSIEETKLDVKTKKLLSNVEELKHDPSNIDLLIEMSNKMLGK